MEASGRSQSSANVLDLLREVAQSVEHNLSVGFNQGANVPTDNTEFQFKAGDLNFKSTSYDWLIVVAAASAKKSKECLV
jgi:hypothetical protein